MEHIRNMGKPEYLPLGASVRLEDFLTEKVPLYVTCWRCGDTYRYNVLKLLIFARASAQMSRLEPKLRCNRCRERTGRFVVRTEDTARLTLSKEEKRARR